MNTEHNITDLVQKRNVYGLITKSYNVQRAIAYCDEKGLNPLAASIDKSTKLPIITIESPEAGHQIVEKATQTGSNMMTTQITFAGQPIADLIWVINH
ncbi:hypothetical protein P8629_01560 [Hydrogenovibrio sp. 3SP14C1]|uniref:hypothetical protein n=1 Tax=Hydrogenovibrio sp. 3SP14C1 TaxID=3038774 RepID=UPI0024177602|nr:hypothetical protein [Hydrogenovibrio sp. 3SP14C1]MDG4811683.1 hypothetical protein [Hydrogenovibrio sp. 3SP14C1]